MFCQLLTPHVSQPYEGVINWACKVILKFLLFSSGRMIKRKLEHLVEVRPTRPVRTAFEIIDYFKCEMSEKKLRNYAAKTYKNNRTFVR